MSALLLSIRNMEVMIVSETRGFWIYQDEDYPNNLLFSLRQSQVRTYAGASRTSPRQSQSNHEYMCRGDVLTELDATNAI
jgi:hypothetical protein